ncbi:MAG: PKD domain-containing protein [Candidatus Thermoplasmatota archaeon]|nr:PKD domain-containing protein [Candidatus Thermoplasmatota archaeon]
MNGKVLMAMLLVGLMVGGAIAFVPEINAADPGGWTWSQTDPSGDVTVPVASWADVTKISAKNDNSNLVLAMDLASLTDPATGDVVYVIAFTVNEKTYQSGVEIVWVAGTAQTDSQQGWSGFGDMVGTYEIDTSANQIRFTIPLKNITAEVGNLMTDIYARVGTSTQTPAGGFPNLFDMFDGVEPWYVFTGSNAPVSTGGIALTSDKTEQSVKNGVTATYTLTLTSNKTENTTVALTANTVDKWDISISPNSIEVPAGGTATVTLSVTPGAGVAADEKAVVTANATFTGGYASVSTTTTSQGGEVTNKKPVASFTNVVDGLKVTVDASGSSDPDGDTITYAWNWGDGATGTGKNAEHTYAAAGTYTVSLIVNDGKVSSDPKEVSVTVASGTSSGGKKGTPGFEMLALIGAIGIAAVLLRRK